MTSQANIERDAMKWHLALVPEDDRPAVRARLEAAGRVLVDGVWRKRPAPAAISGEIVVKGGGR